MAVRITWEILERLDPEQAARLRKPPAASPVLPMGVRSRGTPAPLRLLPTADPADLGPWQFRFRGLPANLNSYLGAHWSAKHRQKKRTYAYIHAACLDCGVPTATARLAVTVRLTLARGRKPPDHDNLLKALLDGLVAAGALVDDGPDWCEIRPMQIDPEPGPTATTVILELTDGQETDG